MSLVVMRKALGILLLLVVLGTTSNCLREQRKDRKDDDILQNIEEMKLHFSKLTLDEQYQLYKSLRAKSNSPGYTSLDKMTENTLLEKMTENDEQAFLFFQKKLLGAVAEDEIDALTEVFRILAKHGMLQNKTEIWDLLKTKVGTVKTLRTRSKILPWLHEIEMHMKYKGFFFGLQSVSFTSEMRRKQFHTYPLEDQLELCLYAMSIEPPLLEFADYLAQQGPATIPMLVTILKTDYAERSTQKVLYIFEALSANGSLCGRSDVISEIKDCIDLNPNDESIKKSYQRILENIHKCTGTKGND